MGIHSRVSDKWGVSVIHSIRTSIWYVAVHRNMVRIERRSHHRDVELHSFPLHVSRLKWCPKDSVTPYIMLICVFHLWQFYLHLYTYFLYSFSYSRGACVHIYVCTYVRTFKHIHYVRIPYLLCEQCTCTLVHACVCLCVQYNCCKNVTCVSACVCACRKPFTQCMWSTVHASIVLKDFQRYVWQHNKEKPTPLASTAAVSCVNWNKGNYDGTPGDQTKEIWHN